MDKTQYLITGRREYLAQIAELDELAAPLGIHHRPITAATRLAELRRMADQLEADLKQALTYNPTIALHQ